MGVAWVFNPILLRPVFAGAVRKQWTSFTRTITPLTSGKTYYYQAYAANADGWGKGAVMTFTTPVRKAGLLRSPISHLHSFCLLLGYSHANSQQGNIWYFGEYAGLSFNTTPPTALLWTIKYCRRLPPASAIKWQYSLLHRRNVCLRPNTHRYA